MSRRGVSGKSPKSLQKEILEVFKRQSGKALNHKQVASKLGVMNHSVRAQILSTMGQLGQEGKLESLGRGKFIMGHAPGDKPQGTIQITRFGRGFVMQENGEEISVSKGMTGVAFWGDTVELEWMRRGKKPTPRVARIVERMRSQYVVTIERVKDYAFGHPADQRLHTNFFIPARHLKGAKTGEKVILALEAWDDPSDAPTGRVVEILGKQGDHNVEMHAILAEYGLPYAFPASIEKAAKDIHANPYKPGKRKDFRKTTTLTIDPADAKDFDDALSVNRLGNGLVEVGVHIADVTHFLRPGTPLDDEARKRATSVYLVDRTVPMLPEVLSNDLCSLRPNEDRLAFSAVFTLDKEGVVQKEWFGRTTIHSDRRFTYQEAQDRIESGKGDFANELQLLQSMAVRMRARRFEAGGIDFNTEEVKFELDPKTGEPLRVVVKEMLDANRLIEDFMLLANVRVARFLALPKDGRPTRTGVYRIHDEPKEEKLRQLGEFVRRFGIRLPKSKPGASGGAIRALIDIAKDHEAENVIKTMAIRSMAKAEYSTENIGHYGLSFPFYSHFTSPIRRYPDVLVHRLLQHYLDGGSSQDAGPLETLCKHSGNMEKHATDAERASIKYKQVEYLGARLGETFYGIISGVIPKGLFVELEDNKCEGFLSKSELQSDQYVFDDDQKTFTGLRSGRILGMGDRIAVRVASADLARRQLEFELP